MSERKVLNKYYPPDFDPAKIPRMKLAKNRQYTVRLMAPFNMRCKTCGEYIYKGKKFNARKEDVEGSDYLGIRIYRFYIKCTRCLQEISFKTDPRNTDYEIEAGATRNFMALKLAEEQAQREEDEEKEEEATNPMKLLEKRTQQSKNELEILESLEEIKDMNLRQQSLNYDAMLEEYNTTAIREKLEKLQEERDEQLVKELFKTKSATVVEEEIVELPETTDYEPAIKKRKDEKLSESSITPVAVASTSTVTKPSILGITKPKNNLVKRKNNLGVKINSGNNKSNESSNSTEHVDSNKNSNQITQLKNDSKLTEDDKNQQSQNSNNEKVSGLSLLGNYSGSSEGDSD